MTSLKPLFVATAVMLTTACQTTVEHDPRPNDPFFAPIVPEIPVEQIANNGSLFSASQANSLYSDAKGRKVGDIITVILRENTSATKSANTTLARDSQVQIDPITGPENRPINFLGMSQFQLDLSAQNDFTGDASANQSNNLNGNISVTVVVTAFGFEQEVQEGFALPLNVLPGEGGNTSFTYNDLFGCGSLDVEVKVGLTLPQER